MWRYTKFYPLKIVPAPLSNVYLHSLPSAESVETSAVHFVHKHKNEYEQLGIRGACYKAKRWYEVAWYYTLQTPDRKKAIKYLAKTFLTFPFQRPSFFLIAFDNLIGTCIWKKYFAEKR
jgi:hypothetical protein